MTAPFKNDLTREQKITKVREMAESMDDEEIATLTSMPIGEIQKITAAMPETGKFWVRNLLTGRVIVNRTWRGCYRMVCLLGWTEWDHGRGNGPEAAK